jgi:LysM repeat protein
LPISASAGLVSVISNFFNRGSDYVSFSKNVQHITLLASTASRSNSPQPSTLIVDENALAMAKEGNSEVISENIPTSDQISIYVVREGDTLSQIAEMFNVTVNTIKWNNDIKSNTVRPGDTLVILPISGVRHTVKKGDTVASIAKLYHGDATEISVYNDLNGGTLAVGTVVIIPDGEITHSPTSGSGIIGSVASGLKEYVGYYLRPVAGGKKTQGIHGYNGIDIAAVAGTPIMAAAQGDVIIARSSGWNGGYGSYVVIKHPNGTQTLYAHLATTNVSTGDTVNQGDIIGGMGRTGKSTGVHLHFEIRGAKNPF